MREYIEEIKKWSAIEGPIAISRVIKTWGSSPRPMGSMMFINSDGRMIGSVSGGCVEGAVVKKSLEVISSRAPRRLEFGVSDEEAWSVGLSCGGSIQVFLQSCDFSRDPVWSQLLSNQESNKSSILVSSLDEKLVLNSLVNEKGEVVGDSLSSEILEEANKAYTERTNKTINHEGVNYFIQVFPRKSILLAIGAAHITVDLVALGKNFGFETIVIDPRGYFAQNIVFSESPDQLIEAYPSEVLNDIPLDAYTFCTILSHDPKIDDNALQILLKSKVGYIGALGSRKTHAKRTNRLLEGGFSQEMIDKIHAPIGMPIHAKSAKEIALAILGEIIKTKNANLQ